MGLSRLDDCLAASLAESLAYDALLEGRLSGLDELCGLVGDVVCIAGGSASLADHVDELRGCSSVVAVDGATSLLLSRGVGPSIIVTDLDGRWSDLLHASRLGAYMVVHVHGDNRAAASLLAPRFERVMFTTQCPGRGRYSVFIPGFTDGERAFALALLCKPALIRLYGMRVWEPVGWWSKPWLRGPAEPWPAKKRKLVFAGFFFSLFAALGRRLGCFIEFL